MLSPVLRLARLGWHHAGKYRRLMLIYLFLFLVAQAIALTEPIVIGKLLNALQTAAGLAGKAEQAADIEKARQEVMFYLAIFAATQFGFWLFHGPGRIIERYAAFHIKVEYKSYLFAVLTSHPMQWHREHHSGDSIDKINKAANALWRFCDESFDLLYMVFRLVGAVIVLLWFMPWVGAAALAATAACALMIVYFDTKLNKKYIAFNLVENRAAAAFQDFASNIVTVLTLRLERRLQGALREKLMASLSLFQEGSWLNEWKWCLTTVTITLMIVFCLGGYTMQVLTAGGALMAGTFFTLFEYLRSIGNSFYSFALTYGTVVQHAADISSADGLLLERPENGSETVLLQDDRRLPKDWKRVEVSNLTFAYEDDEHREHHIYDVAVDLERGKAIAFVGSSGSGKTTLLSLLRGLNQAVGETVLVDGVKSADGLRILSSCTTLMPQDPEIFNDSVKNNVCFATDASTGDIMEAVKLARFEGVLARLNKGLETNVQEKGVNLSGGEKQRLALARGLFFAKDSEIVLADEPTSSVDAENERAIYENMISACREKCLVSSVHKLNLLDLFDYIYVFADGRVVEHGTFAELREKDGNLSKVYKANYQLER